MVTDIVSEAQSQRVCDREALRSGLEETRTRFHALLDSISDDRWLQGSPTSMWTVGEVLLHLTWALEQLPQEIASARRGRGMFNMPKRLADPLSYWFIRWSARNSTRESIRRRYDAAISASIRALDEVKESEWTLGARFYGEGFYTIADLFQTPAHHLSEHTHGI